MDQRRRQADFPADGGRLRDRLGQTLAGDGVHPRLRGGCERIVAAFTKGLNQHRSDEAGASDDDDLHGISPLFST